MMNPPTRSRLAPVVGLLVVFLVLLASCSSDSPPPSGETGYNDCGGETTLTLGAQEVRPGDECGPCREGTVACDGTEDVQCEAPIDVEDCDYAEAGHFNIEINEAASTLDVSPGDPVVIEAHLRNLGDSAGTRTVDFQLGDITSATREHVELQPDETRELTFAWTPDDSGFVGTTTAQVWTTDDQDSAEVSMGEFPTSSALYHNTNTCDAQQLCAIATSVGQNRELAVRLVGPDDEPVEDALVDFDLEHIDGASETELSMGSDFTDDDGVAGVTFLAGDNDNAQGSIGEASVIAEVQGEEDVNTLDWDIVVNPTGQASYFVQFENLGESDPDQVQPLFFDSNTSCDDARTQFFDNGTWPTAEFQVENSDVNPDGNINPAQLHPVGNDESYTVVGIAQQQIGQEEVDVAYGCNDDNEPVTDGQNVTVPVDINDHIPHLGEHYDTTSDFVLTDALPGPVQSLVDILGTLADNPAEFIIGGEEHTGLIDDLLLPYLPDSIVEEYIDPIINNPDVVDTIHDYINEWLEDSLPDFVTDGQQVVGDVTDALNEFTVNGQIYFEDQPTPGLDDGQAVGHVEDAHHLWSDMIFEWDLGCGDPSDDGYDQCAQVPIGVDDIGAGQDTIIEGDFDATLAGSSSIDIEDHSLTLHYGALLAAAFEQMVLPRLFDDSVTSVDGAVEYLLGDCDDFASIVDGEESGLEQAAENMCEELMGQATDAMYDYVEDNLQAGGDDDSFTIETPDDEPCSMQQPDEYGGDWPGSPLPYIDTLGMVDEGMDCDWDVEVTVVGDDPIDIDGSFEGQFAE